MHSLSKLSFITNHLLQLLEVQLHSLEINVDWLVLLSQVIDVLAIAFLH